jgi:putative PIN family toxin of toxin-antitoxin system
VQHNSANTDVDGFIMPAPAWNGNIEPGQPVFSPATSAELEIRNWRPKFARYLSMDDRKQLRHDASSLACWVTVLPVIAARMYCRDAEDEKMIHAALAAKATLLVTGDDDLSLLHPLDSLNILMPRAALESLTSQGIR